MAVYHRLMILPFLLTIVVVYILSRYQSNRCHGPSQKRVKHQVLIITEARSGSSFLGDLIQQASSTYYNFEPYIFLESNNHQSISDSSYYYDLLLRLLNCQMDQLGREYLKPVYWKVDYLKWNSMLTDSVSPTDRESLFNMTLHKRLCGQAQTILIKTIRFTLENLWKTMYFQGWLVL